jgi:hypothetical protein
MLTNGAHKLVKFGKCVGERMATFACWLKRGFNPHALLNDLIGHPTSNAITQAQKKGTRLPFLTNEVRPTEDMHIKQRVYPRRAAATVR